MLTQIHRDTQGRLIKGSQGSHLIKNKTQPVMWPSRTLNFELETLIQDPGKSHANQIT